MVRPAYDDAGFGVEMLRTIVRAMRRRIRLLAGCFLALSIGITAAFLSRPPLYQGDVKFLIKQDRAEPVLTGLPDPVATGEYYRGLSETELMSQAELIRSRDLIRQVAIETGLTRQVRVEHPRLTEAEAVEEAADAITEELDIWPVKRTWLINVSYTGEDRQQTRKVLDTLARLYLEKHLELQRPVGAYQFFDQQAEQARVELAALRARLASFSTRHQVASAALEKQAVVEKLNDFDALRRQAAAQLAESQQRLGRLTAEWERAPRQHTSMTRTDTGAATEIRNRILTLEMQRTQLLQKFTPAYRGVQQIEEQLHDARAALEAAERTPVVEKTVADNPTWQWLDTEVARARAEHDALRARVQALGESVGQYRTAAQTLELRDAEQQDLARERKVAEDKYLLYAQKREEARISDELDRTRIANVVIAEGPTVAIEPHRDPSLAFLPLLLGVALLLSGGTALAVDALSGPGAAAAAEPTPVTPPSAPPRPAFEPVAARIAAADAKAVESLEELRALNQAAKARLDARRRTEAGDAAGTSSAAPRWPLFDAPLRVDAKSG